MATDTTTTDTIQAYLAHPSPHVVNRAKIILLMLEGKSDEAIAANLDVSLRTVKKWQSAWNIQGMAIFPDDEPDKDEPEKPDRVEGNPGKIIHPPAPKIIEHEPEEPPPLIIEEDDDEDDSKEEPISPDDTLAEAGRKIMLEQLASLIEQEADVRKNKDSEAVHQMRIATRRWRSVYKGFGNYLPKSYSKRLSTAVQRTAKHLGQLRDLDVFLDKTRHYIKSHDDVDKASLKPLLKLIKQDRRKARKHLRQWLDAKKYGRFVKLADKKLHQTPKKKYQVEAHLLNMIVPELIQEQFAAVQAYNEKIHDAKFDTLHNLRIECKRLRYLLEAFADVLGDEAQAVIDAVKALQDHLGDLNDAHMAMDLIRSYGKRIKKSQRKAVKLYHRYRKAEAKNLRATFPEVWSEFNQEKTQQALTQALDVL